MFALCSLARFVKGVSILFLRFHGLVAGGGSRLWRVHFAALWPSCAARYLQCENCTCHASVSSAQDGEVRPQGVVCDKKSVMLECSLTQKRKDSVQCLRTTCIIRRCIHVIGLFGLQLLTHVWLSVIAAAVHRRIFVGSCSIISYHRSHRQSLMTL